MIDAALQQFLDTLADAASAAILPYFRQSTAVDDKRLKGVFDPVTEGDRAGERAMRALINAHYPDHGILGEEYGAENLDADYVWVLDPIDGTRAFISGLPVWGTLIGLTFRGRPVLGMMAQPFTGERYAGDTTSAWYTGPGGPRSLAVRPRDTLAESTLMTTSPFLFKGDEATAYDRVQSAVRMARYGTDCYAYAMVAAGNIDLVVENGLQAYDIVALIPIIEGAGGLVTDWSGGPCWQGGQVLACGDRRVHAEALEKLRG
ncbi:MAG: histidinol-phosphatase [Hyphomicrobiaceae bacterium]|nr:histidinol-phosphatase [Hyphomicrobiaceae bacterium]